MICWVCQLSTCRLLWLLVSHRGPMCLMRLSDLRMYTFIVDFQMRQSDKIAKGVMRRSRKRLRFASYTAPGCPCTCAECRTTRMAFLFRFIINVESEGFCIGVLLDNMPLRVHWLALPMRHSPCTALSPLKIDTEY